MYQRKKGRDLFDLALALNKFPDLNLERIIQCFNFYLEKDNQKITRAQFEKNFYAKVQDKAFLNDMKQLIRLPETNFKNEFDMKKASYDVYENFIAKLPGNPWKNKKITAILAAEN